ncbi:MAG: redox-regulated ATPase YchF [Alphaproteobacteria bacterium]|nr:redox-regulated ATPase YchF [Alphaproteobacteria bacterium]MBP9877287.1 redox-regulated ATPase YchF [Alphaproteobacteria bacterium]
MGFKCGIIGLPNVGKSTLFNAVTATHNAQAANYPFCTIEPNSGSVDVPDARLALIAALMSSEAVIPNQVEFVDIAGLVKGASKGEGLGNQFLANIREVNAIIHVLRCFVDTDITHVEGDIDPLRDAAIVETELMLADLESLEKQYIRIQKRAKTQDKEALKLLPLIEMVKPVLEEGLPARHVFEKLNEEDKTTFRTLNLLTSKPVLYVCNVEESAAATGNDFSRLVETMAHEQNAQAVFISAAIESEIANLEEADKLDFIASLGLSEPGLHKIIRSAYELLEQITFFTAGPKETRAWTLKKGLKAPQAAGVIHTDFERGFIKAETIAYDDFIQFKGEQGAKEAGKLRQEGKEYLVKDGDIFHFKFNV